MKKALIECVKTQLRKERYTLAIGVALVAGLVLLGWLRHLHFS